MTSIYRQRETYQKQSVDAPHDNVNSLPAPPPTVALQSHKCTVKSIWACICILPTVEGHIRMTQDQSPSLSPKQQRPYYMEADFEGLDPEVSPTRRQLHDRKLKLRVQFWRLNWNHPNTRSQQWINKCCTATAGPVPPRMIDRKSVV